MRASSCPRRSLARGIFIHQVPTHSSPSGSLLLLSPYLRYFILLRCLPSHTRPPHRTAPSRLLPPPVPRACA
jgi:hypothetical protein